MAQEISRSLSTVLVQCAEEYSNSYSGRGMYGSTCLSVTVDSPNEYWAIVLEELQDYMDDPYILGELANLIRVSAQDSMGFDQVLLYFPGYQLESDD